MPIDKMPGMLFNSRMRKIPTGFLAKLILCAGYGALAGYLAMTSAELPPGMESNGAYANFALIAGALTGLGVCLLGYAVYLLAKKGLQNHLKGFEFTIFLLSGVLTGFLASYIVHVSADAYGLVQARSLVVIVGSIIPAFIGGLIPAVTLLIVRP